MNNAQANPFLIPDIATSIEVGFSKKINDHKIGIFGKRYEAQRKKMINEIILRAIDASPTIAVNFRIVLSHNTSPTKYSRVVVQSYSSAFDVVALLK
jgi:hypothetical protein